MIVVILNIVLFAGLFMLYDIALQKKKALGWYYISLLVIFTLSVLGVSLAEDFGIITYMKRGYWYFLSLIIYVFGFVYYPKIMDNASSIVWHAQKWAIMMLTLLPLLEFGYIELIPILTVLGWIANDVLWALSFKQPWYYTGNGKGDFIDEIFNGNHLINWIVKILILIGSTLIIIL